MAIDLQFMWLNSVWKEVQYIVWKGEEKRGGGGGGVQQDLLPRIPTTECGWVLTHGQAACPQAQLWRRF